MSSSRSRVSGVAILSCGALLAIAGSAGCAGYRTTPEASAWPSGGPNVGSVEDSVTTALKFAVQRVPPPDHQGSGGQYAISPPAGLRQSRYLRMVQELGPDAFAVTPESQHLPTYIVGAVLVRGSFATIEVYCPVLDRWGDIAYKPYTLELEGGVRPWRVLPNRVQAWQIGSMEPPARYFLPPVDQQVATEAEQSSGG